MLFVSYFECAPYLPLLLGTAAMASLAPPVYLIPTSQWCTLTGWRKNVECYTGTPCSIQMLSVGLYTTVNCGCKDLMASIATVKSALMCFFFSEGNNQLENFLRWSLVSCYSPSVEIEEERKQQSSRNFSWLSIHIFNSALISSQVPLHALWLTTTSLHSGQCIQVPPLLNQDISFLPDNLFLQIGGF